MKIAFLNLLVMFLAIMNVAFAQGEVATEEPVVATEPEEEVKEEWDGTIPYDAWLSWGVGGAIMLFVAFAIVWTCYERCKPRD